MSIKEQLDSKCRKLEEALNTINSQKDEIEKLMYENRKYSDELVELKNADKNLENKFDNISSQIGTIFLHFCTLAVLCLYSMYDNAIYMYMIG